MDTPRYKAFISYSHRDQDWSRWLQRALEKYRIPKRLVGQPATHGPIPGLLRPIFRDREDLSSASDLSTQIKEELQNSECLIVICSPTAAGSKWVNEEIRYFRQLPQGERVLALIVEGDPQARQGGDACFPPAMLELPGGGKAEPLAADVRKYADGKRLALLKIVAGMLGVRLDELRQRDAQRRARRRLTYAALGLVLATVMSWLVWSEATTRAAAEAQRASTEELLDFMLGDLKRLAPIEGLEVLSPEDGNQAKFRQELGFDQLDSEQLLAKALEWRESGLEKHQVGELEQAMELFQQSRAAIIEFRQREGNTPQALFELGQTEFYVGLAFYDMGEPEKTRQSWTRYGAVTRRLVNAEPNNAAYVMELSYTLMNLGALEQSRPDPDASKSLQLIQASIQYNRMALVLDPANSHYREELVTGIEWLADAWVEQCELGEALDSRQQSVELRRELVRENPEDAEQQTKLAFSLSGLAGVQQQAGLNDEATIHFREVERVLSQLHQAAPGDAELEWELVYRRERLARHLLATGNAEAAWKITHANYARMEWLSDPVRNLDYVTAVEAASFRLDYARLLLLRGDIERGETLLREVTHELTRLVREKPGVRESLAALTNAYFEFWKWFGFEPSEETSLLLEGYLADPAGIESCSDANLAARLAIMKGNETLARHYTNYSLDKGYLEADFISFCTVFRLCERP